MNRLEYFNFIESKLSELATRIEVRGGVNLLELHLHSEDFYQHLLNLIFDWKLENVNAGRPNTPGIDLKDTGKKIVVQVSSTSNQVKVQSALNKLSGYEDYSFKFISISKDAKDLRTKSFDNPHKVKFVPYNDILDIKSLLANIKNLPIEKLLAVYELLKKEFGGDSGKDWREKILLIAMVVIVMGSLGFLIGYQYLKLKKFSDIRFKPQDTVQAQSAKPDTIQKKFLIYKLGEEPISDVTVYFGIPRNQRQIYEITNAQLQSYEKSVLNFFVESTTLPDVNGSEVGPDADSLNDEDSKRENLYVYRVNTLSPDYVYVLTVTLRKKESGPEVFSFKLKVRGVTSNPNQMQSGDYIRIFATELLTLSLLCLLLLAFVMWKMGDKLLGIGKRRATWKLRLREVEENSLSGLVVFDGNEGALILPSGWRICLRTQSTNATLVSPPSSPVDQDGNFRINGVRSGPVSLQLCSADDNQEQFEIVRVERDGISQPETIDMKEGEHIAGIRVIVKPQPNPKPSSKLWVAPMVILCFVGLAPGTIAQNPGTQPSPSPPKEGTVTGYVKINDAKRTALFGARLHIEIGKDARGERILKRVSSSKEKGDYTFFYAIGFQVLVIEKTPFYKEKTIPGVNIQLQTPPLETIYLDEDPANIAKVELSRDLIVRGDVKQGSELVNTLVGLCNTKQNSARYLAPQQFSTPIRYVFPLTTSVQRPSDFLEDPECELVRMAQGALIAGDLVAAVARLNKLLSLLPPFKFRASQSVYIIAFRDPNSIDPRMLSPNQSLDAQRKVTQKIEEWAFFNVVNKPSEADFVFLVHLDEHSVEGLVVPLAAYELHYRENFDLELLRDAAYERYQVGPLKLATLSRLTDRLVKQFRQKTISGN